MVALVSDMALLRLLAPKWRRPSCPLVVTDEIAAGVVRVVEELGEWEEVFYGIVVKGRDIGALSSGVVRPRGRGVIPCDDGSISVGG